MDQHTTGAIMKEYSHIKEVRSLGRAASLKVKEALGRPLLGLFVSTVQNVLHVKFPQRTFMWDMEYPVVKNRTPGQNPATDAAILLLKCDMAVRPLVLYEYKPTVDT